MLMHNLKWLFLSNAQQSHPLALGMYEIVCHAVSEGSLLTQTCFVFAIGDRHSCATVIIVRVNGILNEF